MTSPGSDQRNALNGQDNVAETALFAGFEATF